MRDYFITGFTAISLFVILLLQGCNVQPVNLEFSTSECNDELTQATIIGTLPLKDQIIKVEDFKNHTGIIIKPIIQGIQESNWLNDNTLYVKSVILTNCAYKINSGNYQIDEDRLLLKYNLKRPFGGIQAECICAHELIYTIKDMDKKDYQIDMEVK